MQRHILPLLIFCHTGSLFKQGPALLRLRFRKGRDVALRDDGKGIPSQSGIHHQVGDVLQPARRLVDQILCFAVLTAQAPGDLHLIVGDVEETLCVVKYQRHLGQIDGFSLCAAAEDDIAHAVAAAQ